MSNDIIASLKSELAQIQGGVDEDTLAVAGGGLGGSKRISIKGGVFRKMAGGKEVGTIEDRHMNVIFVKMAHAAARTYYSGTYKEGEKASPTCWSSDGKTPDAEVKLRNHLPAMAASGLLKDRVVAVVALRVVCRGVRLLCCRTILMAM